MQHEVRFSSGKLAFAAVVLLTTLGLAACGKSGPSAGDPGADARIAPIGKVETDAPAQAATAPAAQESAAPAEGAAAPAEGTAAPTAHGPADGKAVFDAVCFACHNTGAAGAPIIGKQDQWAPRIAQGLDLLHKHAIEGLRGMPPKGGAMHLSDAEVSAAVDYIVGMSK